MKECIGSVIGRNQFGFVKGRQILDCSLIANEVIDDIKANKKEGAILKIDFEKAYDSVDWDFLDFVMKKMKFGVRWRRWIQQCISSASLSILVNGSPTRQFSIKRGLRQGCSLSPFLFNIVAEALSIMCDKARSVGCFEGILVGSNNVEVSLIQFADDTLLFCKPEIRQLANIKRMLRVFQLMSGLKINFSKCNFFGFGRNLQETERWVQENLCAIGQLPTIYLGLPLGGRANSKALWAPVEERLQFKINSWKANYLSMGGRVTMIKSVMSSIPMYYMSLFKLPMGVKEKLEKIMRRFLWGGSEMKRKMHLVDWNTVTYPKEMGGLGISNLELQNSALLSKWLWRFGVEINSMWRQIIISKTNSSPGRLLPTEIGRRHVSLLWRNITLPLLASSKYFSLCSQMFLMLVGNGKRIQFWEEPWIDGIILKFEFPRIFALALKKEGNIEEFGYWQNASWVWDVKLRRNAFDWESQQWSSFLSTLEGICLTQANEDKLVWKGNSNGKYTVASFYNRAINPNHETSPLWKTVWSGYAPPKVETFCWLVMRERIAVKAELVRRGMITESAALCPLCKKETETVKHLFFHCPLTWSIWSKFMEERNVLWCCPKEPCAVLLNWVEVVGNKCKKQWSMLFFTVLWSLWLFRNQIVFKGLHWDFLQVLNTIKCRYAYWHNAKWPSSVVSMEDVLRGYDEMEEERCKNKNRAAVNWSMPCEGSVKFNVDGSAIGKPGQAGVGGILRDSTGNVLAIFSKSIGIQDSNVAEFVAIKEAFRIFKESRWRNMCLTVESDSKNAVSWTNKPDGIPWRLQNLSNQLCNLKQGIKEWHCSHVWREANQEADQLAKQGVSREVDLLCYFP